MPAAICRSRSPALLYMSAVHMCSPSSCSVHPPPPSACTPSRPRAPAPAAPGPLTNLALAQQLDPQLPSRLAALYIMGGAAGAGNITPTAEFNVYCDPEAAAAVLRHFRPCTMVCWQCSLRHPVPWSQLDEWLDRAAGSKRGAFIAGARARARRGRPRGLEQGTGPEAGLSPGPRVQSRVASGLAAGAEPLQRRGQASLRRLGTRSAPTSGCPACLPRHAGTAAASVARQREASPSGWVSCDPLAMAVALRPDIVLDSQEVACAVGGRTGRGGEQRRCRGIGLRLLRLLPLRLPLPRICSQAAAAAAAGGVPGQPDARHDGVRLAGPVGQAAQRGAGQGAGHGALWGHDAGGAQLLISPARADSGPAAQGARDGAGGECGGGGGVMVWFGGGVWWVGVWWGGGRCCGEWFQPPGGGALGTL
jgi:hypothetical protein